jgi:hypothetical protein
MGRNARSVRPRSGHGPPFGGLARLPGTVPLQRHAHQSREKIRGDEAFGPQGVEVAGRFGGDGFRLGFAGGFEGVDAIADGNRHFVVREASRWRRGEDRRTREKYSLLRSR